MNVTNSQHKLEVDCSFLKGTGSLLEMWHEPCWHSHYYACYQHSKKSSKKSTTFSLNGCFSTCGFGTPSSFDGWCGKCFVSCLYFPWTFLVSNLDWDDLGAQISFWIYLNGKMNPWAPSGQASLLATGPPQVPSASGGRTVFLWSSTGMGPTLPHQMGIQYIFQVVWGKNWPEGKQVARFIILWPRTCHDTSRTCGSICHKTIFSLAHVVLLLLIT